MSQLPALPKSFSRIDLEALGFEGWCMWAALRQADFAAVPVGPAA
jgi:hypothetical protein